MKAHDKGIIDAEIPTSRSGVWKFGDRWLVISGKQAVVIENEEWHNLQPPVFEGKLVEFENSGWLDWTAFTESFKRGSFTALFEEVLSIISLLGIGKSRQWVFMQRRFYFFQHFNKL